MLKKLSRKIERRREGSVPIKFRFDVECRDLTGLPPAVKQCRVVWSRGPKVQMTNLAMGAAGKGLGQISNNVWAAFLGFGDQKTVVTLQASSLVVVCSAL